MGNISTPHTGETMASKAMIHLNGNILCVVDVESTGDRPGYHDLIQVCVLPLDSELRPGKKMIPFYTLVKPRRPENCHPDVMDQQRSRICEATIKGLDPDVACDLFDEWYNKLGLRDNKRISPLAQNWPFDRAFMIDWLGHESFARYFDGRYRDTMSAALFENDRADFKAEPYPYAKVNLQYLASTLKVTVDKAHDALADCVTTAEVYRLIVMKGLF